MDVCGRSQKPFPDDEESQLVYGFPENYGNPQTFKCVQPCPEDTTNPLVLDGSLRSVMDLIEKINLPLWIVIDVAK